MAVIFVLLPLVPPRLLGAAEEWPAAPRRRRSAAVGVGDLAAAVLVGLGGLGGGGESSKEAIFHSTRSRTMPLRFLLQAESARACTPSYQ